MRQHPMLPPTTTTMTFLPSMATTMMPNTQCSLPKCSRNPRPTNPSPPAAISVPIAPVYKVHRPSRPQIHWRIPYRCPSATVGWPPMMTMASRTAMMAVTGDAFLAMQGLANAWGGEQLSKEIVWGKHRRAGDIEEEATTKIGTLMAHNDDDGHAILGIDGGVEGATNAPGIIIIQQFTAHRWSPHRTPTWTFPIPCSHPRVPIFIHSPLFLWGNRNPPFTRTCDSLIVVHWYPILILRYSLPYGPVAMMTSLPPFSTSGDPMVRSISFSILVVAINRVLVLSHPFPQCTMTLYNPATSPNWCRGCHSSKRHLPQ